MSSLFDPTDLLAEIDAADAAEAKALAERQRKRRAALEPAAKLFQQIATARAEFLARESELLDQLVAVLKEAKKNGAPDDKLDQLRIPPLTTKPSRNAPRARKSKREKTPSAPPQPNSASNDREAAASAGQSVDEPTAIAS